MTKDAPDMDGPAMPPSWARQLQEVAAYSRKLGLEVGRDEQLRTGRRAGL